MNYYFSADWHIGHSNILKYDNRPFETIEEHDQEILRLYNETVNKSDTFYFLGDFCFRSPEYAEEFLSQMNGNKFFIWGNHDKHMIKLYEKYGQYLGMKAIINVNGQEITLDHFSNRVWNRSHHGSWMFYGHSHDNLEHTPWGKSMDVGVASAYRILGQYRPFSFEEIKTILDTREIEKIDHHG
jgi:calcineurin-like phosphoesterase family protein